MAILQKLREATHDIHMELHDHPALVKLVESNVTYEYYLNVLEKFYVFHSVIEEKINNSDFKALYERYRTDTLPNLHHDIETINLVHLNRNFSTSVSFNEAEDVWGYLYLKEGSLLGGTVIYKSLQKNLNQSTI